MQGVSQGSGTTLMLLFLLACVTVKGITRCPWLESFVPFITLNDNSGDVQVDLKD